MKKGFTLIELLGVIVILGIIVVVIIPSVLSIIKKSQSSSFDVLVQSIEGSAKLYVDRHKEIITASLESNNSYVITLQDLYEDNLIELETKDPRTGDNINLGNKIYISYGENKDIDVCYEEKGCYPPTLLVNILTDEGNVVSGQNEGLHYDNVNNVYYFKGKNPHNWIEFNDYLWRIVKINSDGSIKLVFEGQKSSKGTKEDGYISESVYDSSNGYNYDNNLTIKNTIQTWYNNNIKKKNKVLLTNLCNSRIDYNAAGVTKETFYDNECVAKTTSTYAVGLLNGSDYLYASTDENCLTSYKTSEDNGTSCKNKNYLYKNYDYYTMTSTSTALIWYQNKEGSLKTMSSSLAGKVRPTINLINGILVDRGYGTIDKPYTIKEIVSVDRDKPLITINGDNLVEISAGDDYIDAGVTATDNIDGNITSKVVVLSNINTNVIGEYSVTYIVSDKNGNKSVATRAVNVVAPATPENGNPPMLATGMIPVYYDEAARVWKKADSSNNNYSWYDYINQKWANAVTVTSTNRTTYMSAGVGTTIPMSDINTMFVWIPRFSYFIPAGTGPREISVQFETKNTPKSTGNAVSTYYTHPAFTFGNTEIDGIWVGKFETTGTLASPTILPDAQSIRNQTIKDLYDGIKTQMQGSSTYGFSNDSDIHMMKNTEWGAVTYLYHSKYGKYGNPLYASANKEIYMNNSISYYTGRSSGAPGGSGVLTPSYEFAAAGYYTYDGKCALIQSSLPAPCNSGSEGQVLSDKTLAYGASTTGNIYGVYDMSGGSYDYVMGVYKPTTLSGIKDCSGYSTNYAPPATCPSTGPYISQYENLTLNTKYYDRYLDSIITTGYIKGDATYEVSGWYADNGYFVSAAGPWIVRGGNYGGAAAGAFNFGDAAGKANDTAVRIVLLSGTDL